MKWVCYHLFRLSQCDILREYRQIGEGMTFQGRRVEDGARSHDRHTTNGQSSQRYSTGGMEGE